MKKIRLRQVIFLLIALGVAAFIAYSILFPNGFDDSATHVSYKEFYESVEQGSVETATLRENNITFTKYNDSTVYATENPDSPLLKELLMRHGVAVREGVSAEKSSIKF